MSDHLLTALKHYHGRTICYTGGKLSGKTIHASLMALAIHDDGGDLTVAGIDLDLRNPFDRESFAQNCENVDIPMIYPEQLSPLQLNEALKKYDIVVIDLPLTKTLPIELQAKSYPLRVKELKTPEQKEAYCRK